MKKYLVLLFVLIYGTCVFASDYNVYKFDNGQSLIVKQIDRLTISSFSLSFK